MDTTCYTNRELSWLQFNERVLNEAGNARVPLAERLSFASIYQSNLDEFFMVRVGTLMVQMHSDEKIRENKTNMTSEEQVKAILRRVAELEQKKARIYEQLMGELEPQGIRIINFNKLSNEEGALLETYFDQNIAPFLSPMIIGKQQPFPFLNNKQLYALVLLSTKGGKSKTGIVPCTNSVFKRLIEIPSRPGTFMLCEELILHFVSKLYPKYTVKEKSIMRVTRNADIDATDVLDEDLDYRDVMEHLIKQRTRLSPVRLELSRQINDKTQKELAKFLGVHKRHIIKVDTPLDLSFVFQLQGYLRDKTELFYERRSPQMTPALNIRESILDQVAKKDVLLSYPFESMKPFLRMLHEAAEDDSVVSIKMTLYRVAERSKVIDALIEAAENGKEVVVLVELRARFDEANNIEMSKRLEDAGCHIIYGLGMYKVHSKLCLITRHTEQGLSYITQIGTGNYNEKTSRLYTDLSLLTGNQKIGAEAARVFKSLMLGETVEETEHLLVAPKCLQNKVIAMIDAEEQKALRGEPAYVGVKINSLTDKDIIEKLIEASKAGVKIELIVRGICCLVPGIPGETENITIVSVVGRFLEHSRIYRFGVGADEKIYIASADFMTRNTIKRVEVAAPIYDEEIRDRLRHIFDTVMADDEKGKQQTCDRAYVDRDLHEEKLNSQELFYEEAYRAAATQDPAAAAQDQDN
ncbi:polyphosphate kinase 1 [Butyricicoccus sp.]|uniref:polyphosphate kinase 1 n=1 Tax=Butyricicoccus sp. TaxID=2049021 RepID=UPI003F14AA91